MLTVRAPAKVNLTLTVHGRRDDGYHDLTSLVAFAGVGDELSLTPGESTRLTMSGPFGAQLAVDADNLVLRASRFLSEEVSGLRSGHFHLVKRLPLASGIGGGSADAAAALRLLARLNGLDLDDPRLIAAARRTGADVPVCLRSRARVMSGVGDRLGPPLRLPRLFAVLVNPGVTTPTAAVFAALGLKAGEKLLHVSAQTAATAQSWRHEGPETGADFVGCVLAEQANDLQDPAIRVVPEIGDVLSELSAMSGCLLARMSGSGATCFALFADCKASATAARDLRARHCDWWIKPTMLR